MLNAAGSMEASYSLAGLDVRDDYTIPMGKVDGKRMQS